MNLPTMTTDNLTEVLLKIINFTQSRQKVLIQNINAMHTCGFVPRDLPVDEFSRLIAQALADKMKLSPEQITKACKLGECK